MSDIPTKIKNLISNFNFTRKKPVTLAERVEMSGKQHISDFPLATLENTPSLNFVGQSVDAKVLHVYDGDTITVAIPLLGSVFKWKCRMIGIDTPEIRTRNLSEKRMGLLARDALRELVADKIVSLECGKFDKYGRLLAIVHVYDESGTNIVANANQWMLQQGLARTYDGGKRMPWIDIEDIIEEKPTWDKS
jgi:micrococcal nuclease